jgi:hypothetical protein
VIPWYDGDEKPAKSSAGWSIKSNGVNGRNVIWKVKEPNPQMEISQEILRMVEQTNSMLFGLLLAMGMYVMMLIYVTCFGTRTVALITLCFSWGAAKALEVPVQVGPKSIYSELPPPMTWEDQGPLLALLTLLTFMT